MGADQPLAIGLDGPAHFISVGPFQISLANLVVIAIIFILFALALVLPFPGSKGRQ